jgi:putative YhbY family RNA-binding protein
MLNITSAERRALRARAHPLHPVVLIGDAGITDAVIAETDRALKAHELIKVRMAGESRESRDEAYASLCEALGAAPVQHIGKILVLYRPRPPEEAAAPARSPRRRRKAVRKTKKSFQNL